MKIMTSFTTLMVLANKLGKARLSGNKEEIQKAKSEHDAYRDLCLKSDEIMLGFNLNTMK